MIQNQNMRVPFAKYAWTATHIYEINSNFISIAQLIGLGVNVVLFRSAKGGFIMSTWTKPTPENA